MKARVLIVEDESIVQLDLQSRVQRLGHLVIGCASSGEDAVRKAAELMPDLILMDVRLDGSMTGIEAAAKIRATRLTPIIFLTAHPPAPGENQKGPQHPRLSKPFRTAELESAIAQALTKDGDNPASRDHSANA